MFKLIRKAESNLQEEGVHISKLVNGDLTWENWSDSKCHAHGYAMGIGHALHYSR